MSGEGVHVDEATAKKAEEFMAAAVDNMQRTLKKIDDEVAAATHWEGDAKAAFVAASTNWAQHSQELHKKLNAITEQVGHGTRQYIQMEQENREGFEHISL
ncbi:WXG100 family type VII secretion target [Nocardia vinacea]|uniref:WXG100 family type VII secretion target n=1 Tax=Nocardia vinacea TaxID=96468 RepID=A0ABZ1ZA50_9NOCA|nr:WXG100 family type VII secretion target [Nocardia vinacea]